MTLPQLTIKRVSTNNDGTYGVIIQNTTPFALTLEESWKENKRDISCIPAGEYICKRVNSPRFGDTFGIVNVEGRSNILFHWGNTEKDTKGCILVGEEFGYLKTLDDDTKKIELQPAVLSSRKGFHEFMQKLDKYDGFMLKIIWV